MVGYKEPMDITSLIDLDSQPAVCNGLPEGTNCGYLKSVSGEPTTQIINRSANNQQLAADQVVVITNDGRNFVYDPVQYLGSADSYTDYSINLTDQINKADGAPAFLIGGYLWSFEVSNFLDLTPPQVDSVVPVNNAVVPKNTTVQINFSEAVNVLSVTGQASGNPNEPLNNLLISYQNEVGETVYASGQAVISNRFRTVEFSSDIPCEVNGQPVINSCGETPTCFPGNQDFTLLLKAALVDEQGQIIDLSSGITDAAGNSLDGNNNGSSEGQPADNYSSAFSTADNMDLTPPEIISPLSPGQSDDQVPRNKKLIAIFNEYILSSTLNSDNFGVFESACGLAGNDFPIDLACYPAGGFNVYKQNISNDPGINNGQPATKAYLNSYYPYLNPLTNYNSRLTSKLKDLYQNCFNPAIGPCGGGQVSPNCP